MSERLYYTDAYLARFDARVIEQVTAGDRPALLLDRTAFYPASGGQPSDRGSIAGIAVTDVIEMDDGHVLHVVEHAVAPGSPVACEITWPRRFDHMQQHTGQHVLSATVERMLGARTLSVHFGAEACTIDVAETLTMQELSAVEHEVNRVVWENRQVRVRFVDEEEAARLPLRRPPARGGLLRLIDIDNVDLSACGGTHVAGTAEVGMVAILAADRYKGGTRIVFACGGRALAQFQKARDAMGAAARLLSVAPTGAPEAVEKLQAELKQQGTAVRQWRERWVSAEADRLLAAAEGRRVVSAHLPDWDTPALKALAAAVASRPGSVAVLAGAEAGTVVVACGSGATADAGALVRQLTARFGGRGGGRREAAQAGGLAAAPDEILRAAVEYL